jgi:curved DNA-binding protein CbpA
VSRFLCLHSAGTHPSVSGPGHISVSTYYDILGVERGCSDNHLKSAFRRKAKELHPDISGERRDTLRQMQQLITAYKVLIDPERRELYDRSIPPKDGVLSYRDFLLKKGADPESQSKLIFFDLLHEHEHDAVALYDDLVGNAGFNLSDHLDREDFMDCAFLLAEEYEQRSQFLRAYKLLMRIVEFEKNRPYFRHFFPEVTDRLRHIVGSRLPGSETGVVVLSCLEELIEQDFSRKDTAFYLKKAAELHLEFQQFEDAAACLRRGMELDGKLAGAKKLKDRIHAACNEVSGR